MFKNKKASAILICLLFVVITAVMAFVGVMYKNNWDFSSIKIEFPSFVQVGTTPSEDTSSDTSSELPTYILPEKTDLTKGTFNVPEELSAVFLQEGEDF